ncbi:hypothetical protein [Paraglaciecola sp.]|uniref:hypothetical protein n=1 Tax=Paraglaciecola sp. TaxID=1920173 RepID=UPI003EF7879B
MIRTQYYFLVMVLLVSFKTFSNTKPNPENSILVGLVEFDQVYKYEDGEFTGRFGPFLTCFFEHSVEQNSGFKYVLYPSPDRVISALEKEEVDIGFPVTQSILRDKHGIFLGNIVKLPIMLVTHKSKQQNLILGYRSGTLADDLILNLVPSNTSFIHVKSTEQLLDMFRLNRIDGFFESVVFVPKDMLTSQSNKVDKISEVGFGTYVTKKLDLNYPQIKSNFILKGTQCRHLLKVN